MPLAAALATVWASSVLATDKTAPNARPHEAARQTTGTGTEPGEAARAGDELAGTGEQPDDAGDGAERAVKAKTAAKSGEMTMEVFLDRLMMAESGGRDTARNATSTAVGAFQFIEATFLSVAREHFAKETEKLPPAKILALRTDRAFARRAAEAYTRDNAAHLADYGLKPTFPHLRLAYLVGPAGAVRILKASPDTPVGILLGNAVIRANSFMRGMTAKDLIRRAAYDISEDAASQAGIAAGKRRKRTASQPLVQVRCNLKLASCKRWRAMAVRRVTAKTRQAKR